MDDWLEIYGVKILSDIYWLEISLIEEFLTVSTGIRNGNLDIRTTVGVFFGNSDS